MRAVVPVAVLALLAPAACRTDGEPLRSADAADPVAAVTQSASPLQWIPHTFLARPDDQDWVERVRVSSVGESFLVCVEPQLRTPAEGPWRLTLARDGDPAVIRIPGLVVDRATGRITFLVRTDAVAPGDYLLLLELEEGGMASGPPSQGFRFRVE